MSDVKLYEANITGAFRNYYIYGIDPGSFTRALVRGDHETAYINAHHHFKKEGVIDGLSLGMKTMIPPQCLGDNYKRWMEQGGYKGATAEERFTIKLSGNDWIT